MFLKRLWADQTGIILPYVVLILVVIVGFAMLALDGARYMTLSTGMQQAADALARVGAAELDRLPDSITRANAAINNMLTTNTVNVGGGVQNVSAASVTYYSSLPANDSDPMSSAVVATDPVYARFVQVTVTPISMNTILPAAFVSSVLPSTVTAGASAVAGSDDIACGIIPMFVCNPFEQPGDTYAVATGRLQSAKPGSTLIRLSSGAASGSWGPGAFGNLQPPAGSLAEDKCFPEAGHGIGRAMASDSPPGCFIQNGVTLQPGNQTAARNGLNTRWDIYEAAHLRTAACQASYPPDPNVRKGYRPQSSGVGKGLDWCNADKTAAWPGYDAAAKEGGMPMPLDTSFPSVSNIGNGVWDCLAYWNANYTTAKGTPTAPFGCTSTATISRYSVYLNEIANGQVSLSQRYSGETGTPQCAPANASANRRILNVAVINCGSSPVTVQSNADNVPVAGFAKFFLTRPQPSNTDDPYAEFVGLVQPADKLIYHRVQLYR